MGRKRKKSQDGTKELSPGVQITSDNPPGEGNIVWEGDLPHMGTSVAAYVPPATWTPPPILRAKRCGEQSNRYCFILGFGQYAAYHLATFYPMTRKPGAFLNLLKLTYMPSTYQKDAVYRFLDSLTDYFAAFNYYDANIQYSWAHDVTHEDFNLHRAGDPKWVQSKTLHLYPRQLLEDMWQMFRDRMIWAWSPFLEFWDGVHQDCFRVLRPRQFRSNRFFRLGSLLGAGLIELGREGRLHLFGHGVLPRNMQAFLAEIDKINGFRPGLRRELEDVGRGILADEDRYQGLSDSDREFWDVYREPDAVAMVMFRRMLEPIESYREPAPNGNALADLPTLSPKQPESDITPVPTLPIPAPKKKIGRPPRTPGRTTQKEAANELKVTVKTIQNWDQGINTPFGWTKTTLEDPTKWAQFLAYWQGWEQRKADASILGEHGVHERKRGTHAKGERIVQDRQTGEMTVEDE